MTGSEMKNILECAGVRFSEAAIIFGVARSTLYSWFSDAPRRNDYLHERAVKVCIIMKIATESGTLPLSNLTKKMRMEAFRLIIKRGSSATPIPKREEFLQ